MDTAQVIDAYYDAWMNKKGDMREVPLAVDLDYKGPIASFTESAGFSQVAREAGAAVTAYRIRRRFTDGNTVCTIVDWEMPMLSGRVLTFAEVLEVSGGELVRGALIYDAESLRTVMADTTER
jgi:hypothetical protein